jgi:hypothetical protein
MNDQQEENPVAEGLQSIAYALRQLGLADAATSMGAVEAHMVAVEKAGDSIASALTGIAEAMERVADALADLAPAQPAPVAAAAAADDRPWNERLADQVEAELVEGAPVKPRPKRKRQGPPARKRQPTTRQQGESPHDMPQVQRRARDAAGLSVLRRPREEDRHRLQVQPRPRGHRLRPPRRCVRAGEAQGCRARRRREGATTHGELMERYRKPGQHPYELLAEVAEGMAIVTRIVQQRLADLSTAAPDDDTRAEMNLYRDHARALAPVAKMLLDAHLEERIVRLHERQAEAMHAAHRAGMASADLTPPQIAAFNRAAAEALRAHVAEQQRVIEA